MKNLLLKLFSPILTPLENSEGDYQYAPSHRTVLKIMGILFLIVAGVTLYFSLKIDQMAGLFPMVLFGGIGLICLGVAYLGSDKAVAKIWRNRN
ncbi:hypothetical protein [Thiomicrorhabdus sediminis]|uniref:Uncharacterized protein n=1 Tax=Thiomicrorhabdus sediminis TaxID=2580412 RepID=A0A4P9K501_9GAMM|nr:hypothetical protein [Thiomicrorhabdus sediminis]QCU89297.1 hypothetical protein FE785_00955 [Thiomicrorhabdus sediminis]